MLYHPHFINKESEAQKLNNNLRIVGLGFNLCCLSIECRRMLGGVQCHSYTYGDIKPGFYAHFCSKALTSCLRVLKNNRITMRKMWYSQYWFWICFREITAKLWDNYCRIVAFKDEAFTEQKILVPLFKCLFLKVKDRAYIQNAS